MATISHSQDHTHDYHAPKNRGHGSFNILFPLRRWLDGIQVKNARLANLICKIIPSGCPFERDFYIAGHTFNIPPLCKFNPLYDEFIGLRFRALSYLLDECGEDISQYIR